MMEYSQKLKNISKQDLLLDIQDTQKSMYRMNVDSPHYKDLKKHIKKMQRKLRELDND